MNATTVDLPVDLNSEDDTGLPWGFLDESQNPSKTHGTSPMTGPSARASDTLSTSRPGR